MSTTDVAVERAEVEAFAEWVLKYPDEVHTAVYLLDYPATPEALVAVFREQQAERGSAPVPS